MSQTNNGGPAFPIEIDGLKVGLRDYFAGQALALVITEGLRLDQVQGMATRAYQIADAMLAERQKERK